MWRAPVVVKKKKKGHCLRTKNYTGVRSSEAAGYHRNNHNSIFNGEEIYDILFKKTLL